MVNYRVESGQPWATLLDRNHSKALCVGFERGHKSQTLNGSEGGAEAKGRTGRLSRGSGAVGEMGRPKTVRGGPSSLLPNPAAQCAARDVGAAEAASHFDFPS